MKVHPLPKKRNITLRYDVASTTTTTDYRQKKLRRLPHIFAKVLELPFHSNADVFVEETPDYFRFVVHMDDEIGGDDDVRAQNVEIYPGVTKIVIRGGSFFDFPGGELELDVWRFRLPACSRPELAVASYDHGELVVTVPKDVDFDGSDVEDDELPRL